MNRISVISLDKKFRKFEKLIKSAALKTLKILKKNGVEADIYLIGDRQMKFLNKKFRDKNKTTTVLSFEEPRSFVYPKSRFKRIGEIYISIRRIKRQASDSKIADHRSLIAGLLIHSFLHLFGYDHKRKNDRIRMEKLEQSTIKKVKTQVKIG
ncbi:MAG: rRNA maturation RNase YbeY [Patescibacteria group bacterium]